LTVYTQGTTAAVPKFCSLSW